MGTSHKSQSRQAANEARGRLLLAEGALIGLLALCVVLFLALFSYSPDDPGWSHTGNRDQVANLIGPAGAWLADILFAVFGVMAYLLPALLGIRALQILRTYFLREEDQFDSLTWILRVIGFLLVMISATSLADINRSETLTQNLWEN
ncbi:DNA translocase FtsK 4TM domain-containing protein [Porticoccaceae bacterium]|nr:DNA translocase FtsK 4TM domain-containing protein [Porticoccaceae bacterium]